MKSPIINGIVVTCILCLAAVQAAEPVKLKFSYQGLNRLPQATNDNDTGHQTFAQSHGPLAYDPQTDELLIVGHNVGQMAARIRLANLNANITGNKDVTKYPEATLSGNWFEPTLGLREKLQKEYGGQQFRVGGLAFQDDLLWISFWRFYNVQNASLPGLAVIKDGEPLGVWYLGDEHSLKTSRYLATDSQGRLFGGCTLGYAGSSLGPALYRFTPMLTGVPHNGKQPAKLLMAWEAKATPFMWQPPDPTNRAKVFHYVDGRSSRSRPAPIAFTPNWDIVSCVVVDDDQKRQQVIYAVTRPIGVEWYGDGIVSDETFSIAPPSGAGNRGYHKEGQVTSLFIFPNLIASNGKDQRYYTEPLHHLLVRDAGVVTLTVDHQKRTLYLLESKGDWQSAAPILHVMGY